MAYQIDWLVQDRVIYAKVWAEQTLEEIQESNEAVLQYLNAGTPLIHIILDDSGLEKTPVNLAQLKGATQFLRHESLGWGITIGKTSGTTKFLTGMLASLFGIRYRRCETLEEALEFLQQRDTTVNWTDVDTRLAALQKAAS